MRLLLAFGATLALIIGIAACDSGDGGPGDIPRTVPPTVLPSSGESARRPVQGVGPIYEAAIVRFLHA